MHLIGLQGMPRRVADYAEQFAGWNLFISIASFVLGPRTLVFLYNMVASWRGGAARRGQPVARADARVAGLLAAADLQLRPRPDRRRRPVRVRRPRRRARHLPARRREATAEPASRASRRAPSRRRRRGDGQRPRRRQRDARRREAARRGARARAREGDARFVVVVPQSQPAPRPRDLRRGGARRRAGARRPGARVHARRGHRGASARSATPTRSTPTMDAVARARHRRDHHLHLPGDALGLAAARPGRAARRTRPGLPVEHVVVDLDAEGLPFDVTLVLANQTVGGERAARARSSELADEGPHRFIVVVPQDARRRPRARAPRASGWRSCSSRCARDGHRGRRA